MAASFCTCHVVVGTEWRAVNTHFSCIYEIIAKYTKRFRETVGSLILQDYSSAKLLTRMWISAAVDYRESVYREVWICAIQWWISQRNVQCIFQPQYSECHPLWTVNFKNLKSETFVYLFTYLFWEKGASNCQNILLYTLLFELKFSMILMQQLY